MRFRPASSPGATRSASPASRPSPPRAGNDGRHARRIPLALLAASGFAGLGYQIVWTRQATLWLGHEAVAVLAVVAAFFGGMALGALVLGPAIERSRRPARWYAACEAVIGVWSVVLALAIEPCSRGLLEIIGHSPTAARQGLVAWLGTTLLLLPATAAMGATLPAIERMLVDDRSSAVSRAYAANTLGACAGVLAIAGLLVPSLGLRATSLVCAAVNAACAAVAWRLARHAADAPAQPAAGPTGARRAALGVLACTGLLGIGYEVLVVRVLSEVTESTVYTFATLLAVYLVGTGVGSAWQARRARTGAEGAGGEARLLAVTAGACGLGSGTLWAADRVYARGLALAESGLASAIAAEAMVALLAFGPATIAMGMLFGRLCASAMERGASFGLALGVNTLGAAAAPPLFGALLMPALGAKASLLIVSAGYLVLAACLGWRRQGSAGALVVPAIAMTGIIIAAPPLAFVDLPPGGRILHLADGTSAAVSVVEDAAGVRTLHIDNRAQEGSSATTFADSRQALLPLLLHPAPRQALFLGLGTGGTARAAAADAGLEVEAVELLPEVVTAARGFFGAAEPVLDRRLRIHVADARRYVQTTDRRYDLVVADNFHPARSGAANLYTTEHFAAVRGRLAPGGVFCQWLPLHQLDLDTLRSIAASFATAFPHGWLVIASHSLQTPVVGLVGRVGDGLFSPVAVRDRIAHARLLRPPADFGLDDELAVLGSFVAGPSSLARFVGGAALNTDDRPVVAYRALRATYAPDAPPADRLLALLEELSVMPADVVPRGDPAFDRRLAAYWHGRDRYLAAGRAIRPSDDPVTMLARVRAPLLDVLRESPDFRPAYDPLLRLATAVDARDPSAARDLLSELAALQPARTEARDALQGLGSRPR